MYSCMGQILPPQMYVNVKLGWSPNYYGFEANFESIVYIN